MRLVIVDDEPVIVNGLRELIRRRYPKWEAVEGYLDAEEALENCDWDNVQLLLIDINMPGMDGLTFLENLRKRGFSTAVVFITAYARFEYAQAALKLGTIDYILKPVNEEQLTVVLEKAEEQYRKQLRRLHDEDYIRENWTMLRKHFLSELIFSERKIDEEEVLWKEEQYHLQKEWFLLLNFWSYERKEMLRGRLTEVCQKDMDWYLYGTEYYFLLVLIAEKDRKSFMKALAGQIVEWDGIFCGLTSEMVCGVRGLSQCYQNLCRSAVYGKGIPAQFARAAKEQENRSPLDEKELSAPVSQAVQYIREHFQKQLSLKLIAEEIYLHPTYLSNLFKKQTGMTIVEFINWCRIEKAKELLKEPQNRIYWVMEQVGFQNQRYFSQVFKQQTGRSPSAYKHMAFMTSARSTNELK